MKQKYSANLKRYKREIQSSADWRDGFSDNFYSAGVNEDCLPSINSLSFAPIQNSSKLRMLFAYRLPCMYSGIPMIDPKLLSRWMKNRVFSRPAPEVFEILTPYADSFSAGTIEAEAFKILYERSKIHPRKNLKELLQEVKPIYSRILRKSQMPIFHEILEASNNLPPLYQQRFKLLIEDAENKLNERPVLIPFSSYEFKYKLCKIKDDIANGQNIKAKKVMNKLIKESKHLSNTTNDKTIANQKKVIRFLEYILKKSILRNHEQLKELIEISKLKLNKEEIIVPFTRKSFIYDVVRIIEDYPESEVQDNIIAIAQKLPTSQNYLPAYIMKIATEPSEKVGYRLIWPSLASIEHLLPRSCGGLDVMSNFGVATTRENSARKSIDFVEQLERRPNTPKYCQMYVDRLIELYRDGTFDKLNINPKYITDYAKTIFVQSRRKIKLDVSRMYRNNLELA
ncbi:hypothetical protein IJ472_00285 [bacterium]|nr:hypothetical protein [bacterium]